MKISIPYSDFEIRAVRSGGAGGQHVNKVSSKVELYFRISDCSVLTDEQKVLITAGLKGKINEEGILRITEDTSRSQHSNREAVIKKLHQIIEKTLRKKKKRIATKISSATKKKRLDAKKKRSEIKQLRRNSADS